MSFHIRLCVLILMSAGLPVGSILPISFSQLRSAAPSVGRSEPILERADSSLKVVAPARGVAWISCAAQSVSYLSVAGAIWWRGGELSAAIKNTTSVLEEIQLLMQGTAICMAVMVSPIVCNALTRAFVFLRSIFRKEQSSEVCEMDRYSLTLLAQQ